MTSAALAARAPRRMTKPKDSGTGSLLVSDGPRGELIGPRLTPQFQSACTREAVVACRERGLATAEVSAAPGELAHEELHGLLELGQGGVLDAGDPELAVQPRVDLAVAAPVAAADL